MISRIIEFSLQASKTLLSRSKMEKPHVAPTQLPGLVPDTTHSACIDVGIAMLSRRAWRGLALIAGLTGSSRFSGIAGASRVSSVAGQPCIARLARIAGLALYS